MHDLNKCPLSAPEASSNLNFCLLLRCRTPQYRVMDRRAGPVWLQRGFLSSLRQFPQNVLILTEDIFQVKSFSAGRFLTTTRFNFVPLKQAGSYGLQVSLKTNKLYRPAGMPGIPISNLSRKQGTGARGQISTSTGIQESLLHFQIIRTCRTFC